MNPAWWAAHARVGQPGRPTQRMVWFVRRLVAPLVRLAHRPLVEGWEHLPAGPFLLVGNHSACGLSEVLALAVCWLERHGVERPLTGMAHPFAFRIWPTAPFLRGIGAVPSTYEAAQAALAAGIPVLVFPGGDWEALRPVWQARRVDFKGRQGFLRIACRAWIPVVPLGIRGSSYTAPVLWRSRLLAWLFVLPRLIGLKRFPLGLLGAAAILWLARPLGWAAMLVLLWLWLASPYSLLPWIPWTIRLRIGPPLAPEELFDDQGEAPKQLDRAYARVEQAVRELVQR